MVLLYNLFTTPKIKTALHKLSMVRFFPSLTSPGKFSSFVSHYKFFSPVSPLQKTKYHLSEKYQNKKGGRTFFHSSRNGLSNLCRIDFPFPSCPTGLIIRCLYL